MRRREPLVLRFLVHALLRVMSCKGRMTMFGGTRPFVGTLAFWLLHWVGRFPILMFSFQAFVNGVVPLNHGSFFRTLL